LAKANGNLEPTTLLIFLVINLLLEALAIGIPVYYLFQLPLALASGLSAQPARTLIRNFWAKANGNLKVINTLKILN